MKNKKIKTWEKILIVIVFLIALIPIMLLIITEDDGNLDFTGNKEIIIEEDRATIDNLYGYYNEKLQKYVIEGYLHNEDIDYINIIFELYDESNRVIGSTYSDIEKMQKGKTYKIKAYYEEYDAINVVDFKITEMLEPF